MIGWFVYKTIMDNNLRRNNTSKEKKFYDADKEISDFITKKDIPNPCYHSFGKLTDGFHYYQVYGCVCK